MTQQPQSELIQIKDVMAITTFSRNRVYRLMKEDKFPRNIKVGKASYWKRKEINQWIEDLTPATDEQVRQASEIAAQNARKKVH
jgi:prophage regulatory protein